MSLSSPFYCPSMRSDSQYCVLCFFVKGTSVPLYFQYGWMGFINSVGWAEVSGRIWIIELAKLSIKLKKVLSKVDHKVDLGFFHSKSNWKQTQCTFLKQTVSFWVYHSFHSNMPVTVLVSSHLNRKKVVTMNQYFTIFRLKMLYFVSLYSNENLKWS